jgi:8-oxo-dGTP diphosphatase
MSGTQRTVSKAGTYKTGTHPTDWDRDAALTTARILLEIKAVNFRPEEPYTFTSGWKSPVYIDCRRAAVLRRIGFREIGTGTEAFLARGGEHPVLRFAATRDDLFGKVGDDAEAAAEGGSPLLLVAACALIDGDGRILLTRRPEGKKMAGLWEFPGGKLNPGETPEAALIRELKEELDIDVACACLAPFAFASHAYEGFHLLMPLFLCRRWQGTPRPREGQTLAWVRPQKLADYQMPPADKPLVPLLRDFL